MKSYLEMTKDELSAEIELLRAEYRKYQGMELKLDMSRGKPCREQLDGFAHLRKACIHFIFICCIGICDIKGKFILNNIVKVNFKHLLTGLGEFYIKLLFAG